VRASPRASDFVRELGEVDLPQREPHDLAAVGFAVAAGAGDAQQLVEAGDAQGDHPAARDSADGGRGGGAVGDLADDLFEEVRDHVLLPLARALPDAAAHLTRTLTDGLIDALVNEIPGSWLAADRAFDDVAQHRDAYRTWLRARRAAIPALVTEAERARG
jgi:hypothetical protein